MKDMEKNNHRGKKERKKNQAQFADAPNTQ
jgi:hypothetical protein